MVGEEQRGEARAEYGIAQSFYQTEAVNAHWSTRESDRLKCVPRTCGDEVAGTVAPSYG